MQVGEMRMKLRTVSGHLEEMQKSEVTAFNDCLREWM